jgi:DNA segregation ATPase FtsK/SpoIIIE, S-DNA-T family
VKTINGYRADELVYGPGLVSRQRLVIPLWASALGVFVRGLGRAVVWAGRRPLLSVPAVSGLVVWARWGRLGLVGLVVAVVVPLVVVRVAAPAWFAEYVTARVRGQWRLLVVYRRLWRAGMIGAGLVTAYQGRDYLPVITGAHATPTVDALRVRLLYGQTVEDFAAAADGLRHTFTVHRVTVTELRPGSIVVRFYRRDPLVAVVAALPVPAALDMTGLLVGLVEDGTPYRLRLLGTHVLIAGASGAGKGSALWSTIRALAPGIATGHVYLVGIDPKRMELVFARELFAELEDRNPAAMVAVLEHHADQMQARADRLCGITRQHTPSVQDPAVVIVVDELANLTAYLPDRDLRNRAKTALSLLLSQGRAVGYYVIAAVQDPRKDIVAFRDLFPTRITLRVTEPEHVDMTLGDGARDRGAFADHIPAALPGVAYVRLDHTPDPVRVRFGWVTDTDLRALATTHPAPNEVTHEPSTGASDAPTPAEPVIDLRDAPDPGTRWWTRVIRPRTPTDDATTPTHPRPAGDSTGPEDTTGDHR